MPPRPIAILAAILLPTCSLAVDHSRWIDSSFELFWRNPVRAHPGVPLDFRFSVYEATNQALAWSLVDAPIGMTISGQGEVGWTPTAADTGTREMGVRVTRADGAVRERRFRLTTGTGDFLFVSPGGDDAAPGTIDRPLRTLEKAMRSIKGNDGRTIYAREGLYRERYVWETNGVKAPFGFVKFSPDDHLEIRGYPGEKAILDCDGGGGLWAFGASHVVFAHMTVRNAGRGENAGVLLGGDSGMAIRMEVHDSHWPSSANCTGFKIQGGTGNLIDRCVAHDNRDTAEDHWNNTNYLVYCDGEPGRIHVLNSVSWGTNTGFKIKHAGPKKLVLHNNRSIGDAIGFGVGSRHSSVRHCVAERTGTGIVLGIADPNAYTDDSVLAEHNTVVDPTGWGIQIQHSYFKNGVFLRRNLVAGRRKAAGTNEGDHRLFGAWIYDAKASTYPLEMNSNLYFAPDERNIFRLGNSDPNYSWSRWRSATSHDAHSVFADPAFTDSADSRWTPGRTSPARFADGTFAGAFAPATEVGRSPGPAPRATDWRTLPPLARVRIVGTNGDGIWSGSVGDLLAGPDTRRGASPGILLWPCPGSGRCATPVLF